MYSRRTDDNWWHCLFLGAMLLTEFSDGQNWMLEMAKWLSFGGKFAISGSLC